LLREDMRIMIAGSADPGLFCALGRILRSPKADITIVDRCGAPLELIREFAHTRGLRCRTLNRDLLELDEGERYDLVLAHYTLNFVSPDRRAKFFEGLASVLAPGGALVARSHEAWAKLGLSLDDRTALENVLRIYAAD